MTPMCTRSPQSTTLRAVLSLALLLGTHHAYAQNTPSDRWTPWLECWELAREEARDTASESGGSGAIPVPSGDARPRVCIEANGASATFITKLRDNVVHQLTLTADALDHPIEDGDCRGTQRAEWSSDGLRLLSSAAISCPNDSGKRRVSGIGLLAGGDLWLDVQAVAVGEGESVRVRRYRRVDGSATATAARPGTAFTLVAIKDASAKVSPLVLEAALVETNTSLPLSAKALVDLAESSVASTVIDALVALSYPERFVIERTRSADAMAGPLTDPYFLGWAFGFPYWLDTQFAGRPFGYSPYDYAAYGFLNYGLYDPRIIGSGQASDDRDAKPQPTGRGRVIDGRGYTQVRPRELGEHDGGPSGRIEQASRRGRNTTAGDTRTPFEAASDGGATQGGRPSSGQPTGRTAEPR